MSDVCFVFASATEKDPQKTINKYLKDTEYDVKFLHSGKKEKILKKDIDLDFDELETFRINRCRAFKICCRHDRHPKI